MPEQITPLSVLYLLLHGAGIAVGTVLCLYLLLCRGKAIAPDITPPARLRRWAAALFGVMALAQLSATVGVNRYYLSQYFTNQGTSYYAYIHDLRIRYFVARYRELAAAHEPIVAQQLAQESGYHSYSTFSTAFKQRMGQSVTAWMSEEALIL